MPASFTLHEPAPHHPPTLGFGRGGAGNRTAVKLPTSRPAPPTSLSTPADAHNERATKHSVVHNRPFHTGRGGAGNLRPAEDERRLFSFDEELEREEKWRGRLSSEANAAHGGSSTSSSGSGSGRVPVYHIGRGGQGNLVQVAADGSSARRRGSESSGSDYSSSAKKGVSGWVKGLSHHRRA